ncbi:undecaprenyldiphospho-muramoylpentapeptide beta-N-acetylglucosaminyltransferase [bacterium]|nr:undecaprenyldiphospho-muramoylpentapeptide beta-N-acetylglucosaminyltransferase [bacterium]
MSSKKIIITGGGTGGHVFPALAIAEELRSQGWIVQYVGSSHGMESKLVPEANFPFFTVKTGAVKNQSVLKILHTLWQLLLGFIWSIRYLLNEKPNAVIGVGGYVSFPVCLAAFILRIPLFLQEQNSSVGIANRFLGKLAKTIFLGFPQATEYFNPKKCINSGNPLRAVFYQNSLPPYQPTSQFILVLGGSQGSKAINEAIIRFLPTLFSKYPNAKVFHQTGQRDFDSVKKAIGSQYHPNYQYEPFIKDIAELYSKASLVIGRSGALTVSELIQVGRPAIFVPYPRKGQNDQITNAYLIASHGAAQVVEQGDQFAERLEKTTLEIFEPKVLERMAQSYAPLRFGNALKTIAESITAQSR